jgi:hypothetical protein
MNRRCFEQDSEKPKDANCLLIKTTRMIVESIFTICIPGINNKQNDCKKDTK